VEVDNVLDIKMSKLTFFYGTVSIFYQNITYNCCPMQKSDYVLKLNDGNYLPSISEIKEAFPLSESLDTDSKEFPILNPEFTKLHYKMNNYQVYTQEFIASLTKYLSERITVYKELNSEITILEVGAGDGRLTRFLRNSFSELNEKPNFIATDNKDWEIKGDTNVADDVEKIDYKEALEKYKPTIVISCWMNVDVNWSLDFINTASVKEYILIGDVFRTAGFGAGWYLPENSGFECHKLTRNADGSRGGVIQGSMGRFDASPFNPESRTEVYSFLRLD